MMKYAVILIVATAALLVSLKNRIVPERDFSPSVSVADTFPVPKNIPRLLFYIQRDPNTNTICYELNSDDKGNPQKKSPIHIFWIRYPEGGMRKELNFIQRKFAYGINVNPIGSDQYELRSVAYSKLPMVLRKDAKNQYHVYAPIDRKECILTRIFIRIDGGTFWKPNVLYVELKGVDPATGKTLVQRIKPS